MRIPIAFVDANVLFSKTLCDWLFLLRIETKGGMFVLFSSEDSITEVLYNMRRKNPQANGEYTGRRQGLLRKSLDDVVDAFPGEVDFPGKDVNDHHVHAAALACNASYLIADDRGFHEIDSDLLPYEVHSADSFLLLIAENAPQAVDEVILKQIEYWRGKPDSKPLDVALEDAGCPTFASCVRGHLKRLFSGESSIGVAAETRSQIAALPESGDMAGELTEA